MMARAGEFHDDAPCNDGRFDDFLGHCIGLLMTACAPTQGNAAHTESATPAPMTGGWAAASVTAPEVQEAARFAAAHVPQSGAVLASIESAQQQVVAGMNYRLALTLRDGSRRNVVVYRQLNGQLQLTSTDRLPR